jgi:citrate lyase subunit beta/citryl-CoA lyase
VHVEVRINGLDTTWAARDLGGLVGLSGLDGLRIPKAEDPSTVAGLAADLPDDGSIGLHLLVESARGLEAAAELAAAHPLVASIALGEADLQSELGLADERGLAWARGRLVVAAAAAGLPPPAMSVFPVLGDDAGLEASCHAGRVLGFLGRAAIHPHQLPVIERAFMPDEREVEEARAILAALAAAEATGSGTAVLPNGRFVDRAMARRAERITALAARDRS